MADPEQLYQEVLKEQQAQGVSGPVAEGRAKAARARAEAGSPHPKEPKWWAGAQPHLEGGNGAAPAAEVAAPAEEPAEEAPAEAAPAAEEPAEEASAQAAPAAEEPAAAAPAEEAPAAEQPAAEQPAAEQPAAQAAAPAPAAAAPVAAAPVAAAPAATAEAPAEQPGYRQTTGVTHGTPTGNRLRPEDGVATEAQFDGQKAMYERRKLIDELVATGVPVATAAQTGRPRAPWLAVLYLIIPIVVIAFLVSNGNDTAGTEEPPPGDEQDGGGGGGGGLTLVASGIAWDTDQLDLTAEEPTPVTIDNQDPAVHNLSIYQNEGAASSGGEALFTSPDVEASSSQEFEIDPLPKGSYPFTCDYHPAMAGTATVK